MTTPDPYEAHAALPEFATYEFDEWAETRKRHRMVAIAQAEADEVDELVMLHFEIERLIPEAQEMTYRRIAMEYSLGRGISDRTVLQRMNTAYSLKTSYLRVYEHLRRGDFLYAFAEVFPRVGTHIDDQSRIEEFIDLLLPHACNPTMTRYRLHKIGTEIAETLSEKAVEERRDEMYEAEVSGGVELVDFDNGLAQLRVTMPAPHAHAAHDRLAKIAREKKDALRVQREENPDVRVPCLGELETQTFIEIINGELEDGYAHIKGEIRITVPALSLLTGDSRHRTEDLTWLYENLAGISGNAQLEGYGPVSIGDVSKVCGGESTWLRMFIEPETGSLLTTDKYEATVGLKRYLNFRDPTCRWGSCSVAAKHCDKDHTIPYRLLQETSPDNLEHLCRWHHVAKHHAGFTLKQLGGGVLEWSTTSGMKIISEPYRVQPQRPVTPDKPPEPVPPPF